MVALIHACILFAPCVRRVAVTVRRGLDGEGLKRPRDNEQSTPFRGRRGLRMGLLPRIGLIVRPVGLLNPPGLMQARR